MIKPFIKEHHNAQIVEVEDFGIINLNDLPIRVYEDKQGLYQIDWVSFRTDDGKMEHVLSEVGGRNAMSFGGRDLGVIKIHEIRPRGKLSSIFDLEND